MLFDPQTYERGTRYFRDGRVRDLREERGLITAFVEGTRPAPYLVVIDPSNPERHSCSCPVSYACKHVVAVIAAVLDDGLPDSAAARSLTRVLDAAEAGLVSGRRGTSARRSTSRRAASQPGRTADGQADASSDSGDARSAPDGAPAGADDGPGPVTIDLARAVATARPVERRERESDTPRIRLVDDEDEVPCRLAYLVSPSARGMLQAQPVRQFRRRDGTYGRLQRIRIGDPLFATAEVSRLGARIELFGGPVPFAAVADELLASGAPLYVAPGGDPTGAHRNPVRRVEPSLLYVELLPELLSVHRPGRRAGETITLTAHVTITTSDGPIEPRASRDSWNGSTSFARIVLFADGTLVVVEPGDPIGEALALLAGRHRLSAGDVQPLEALAAGRTDRLVVRYPRRVRVVTAEEAPLLVLEIDPFGITARLEGSSGDEESGWHGDEYTLVRRIPFDLYDAAARVGSVLGPVRGGGRYDAPEWRLASESGKIGASAINRVARELDSLGIAVVVRGSDGVLRPLRRSHSMSVSVRSGIDWFKVDVSVEGSQPIDGELLHRLAAGDTIESAETLIVLDEAERERLERLLELIGDRNGRVGEFDLGTMEAVVELADESDPPAQARADLARLLLKGGSSRRPSVPSGLRAELRDYQLAGLRHLAILAENGLGCCLADDMGLGKTVQALAFLLHLRERPPEPDAPPRFGALVVAPVSTLENWRREAARFAPDLRVLMMHGSNRPADAASLAAADLVLTSYATAARSIGLLCERGWLLVCLDEAQAIKNPHAKTTSAMKRLDAAHRLCLTGTPVENHTVDLWSILDFAVPGLLGSLGSFTRRFPKRLTGSDRARSAIAKLERIIAPFVLRRTKESVAPELPPKTEMTLRCEMGARQSSFYGTLRAYHHARLREAINSRKRAEIGAALFTGLLRLRQAALYPADADPSGESVPSIKESELRASLSEVVEAGHKAIVFSQFVTALARMREMTNRAGIASLYLDGQTKRRAQLIDSFQDPDGPPVFFISLKAGGTGINLTAADYVYICDPWWNPQVERQAIDRAHRIGRTRPVVVIRLIAAGSVEEKVALLQERKRALADSLIREETGRLSLDAARELLELFEEDR